jgi:ABC-type multidrug transport system ATPase subunit
MSVGLLAYLIVLVFVLLVSLAAQGRTIIFAIHQPRYSIFKLFDSLTLLANGQTVYHGDATKALKYFEENGMLLIPWSHVEKCICIFLCTWYATFIKAYTVRNMITQLISSWI